MHAEFNLRAVDPAVIVFKQKKIKSKYFAFLPRNAMAAAVHASAVSNVMYLLHG